MDDVESFETLRWEFIKENKKVRKKRKKTHSRPRKRSRKKEDYIKIKRIAINFTFNHLS